MWRIHEVGKDSKKGCCRYDLSLPKVLAGQRLFAITLRFCVYAKLVACVVNHVVVLLMQQGLMQQGACPALSSKARRAL